MIIETNPGNLTADVTIPGFVWQGAGGGWNRADAFLAARRRAGFVPVGHLVWQKNYASRRGFLEARHEQAYLLAKGHPAKPAQPLSRFATSASSPASRDFVGTLNGFASWAQARGYTLPREVLVSALRRSLSAEHTLKSRPH